MRVQVTPRRATLVPGRPVALTVSVANTAEVISGHRIRVLGLDPAWVVVADPQLSLFPGTSGSTTIEVTLPEGVPAGVRSFEVEVSSETPPFDVERVPVELSVPARTRLTVAVDPTSVDGGSQAQVGVLVTNAGSSETDVTLGGSDDEGQIAFRFDPPAPTLAAGERLLVHATLRARRPFAGSPKIRPFRVEAGSPEAPVVAQGTWVQHPRLSRGALALLGLLVAGTVFAAVLAATLSQVVGQSNANRQLALQVAQAAEQKPSTGTGSISGTVTVETTGAPQAGVTVTLYEQANPGTAVASTATSSAGTYRLPDLAAGSYLLSATGAGFVQLWYPAAISAASATPIHLAAGQQATGIDIALGGIPGSIAGQVTGADPTGAVLTVQLPTSQPVVSLSAPPGTSASSATTPAAGVAANGVVVTRTTLGAAGTFDLTGIPSPGTYQLVATKAGDAPAITEVTLGSGQDLTSVSLTLSPGDGQIAGTVSTAAGPLGGATVTATVGTTSVTTVTATTAGQVGTFTLSSLPSPASISLAVSAPGYAAQTLTVALGDGQHLSGIAVTLEPGVGSIAGTATTPAGTPAGGVTVSASNGTTTVTTVTSSVGTVGSYTLANLPVPGTYAVTFSRSDLLSQTVEVALSANQADVTDVNAAMVAATATVSGTVTQVGGGGVAGVDVSLVAGSQSYQVTTASTPTAGAYVISGIAPGTYTLDFARPGGVPVSSIVTLSAGQQLTESPALSPPAGITGLVEESENGAPLAGAQVNLYLADQYPTTVAATTTTDSSGTFSFTNVEAPEDYLVAVSYPPGTPAESTVVVTTVAGQTVPACGSAATGASTGTSAGSSSSSSGGSGGGTCSSASASPILVPVGSS